MRWRKTTGGGMRQVGLLAAAGKLALTEGFARLHEDHANAAYLAERLSDLPGVVVRNGWTQTNMVWLDFEKDCGSTLSATAKEAGILLSAYGKTCRLVTHCDVAKPELDKVVSLLSSFFSAKAGAGMVA